MKEKKGVMKLKKKTSCQLDSYISLNVPQSQTILISCPETILISCPGELSYCL